MICTFVEVVVLSVRVPKDDSGLATKRRAPQPKSTLPVRRVVQGLLLLVAAAIVADALVGDRGLLAMMRARRQHDTLATAIARQRGENARLSEQARRLREDPSAIEEIARRELGLIKSGEKVFIIKDLPSPTKQ